MALFNTDRERPDLEKDAPKKTGIMLGLSTIWRELLELIKLNFIFDLFLLPVLGVFLAWNLCGWPTGPILAGICILVFLVTMPAAFTATSRITVTMVRDENFFLWPDFWRSFAKNFGKALLGGLVFFVALGLLSLAAWVYYDIFGSQSFLLVIILAFIACLVIILLTTGFYFWPMLSYIDLPFKALFKNSLILVMGAWKRSLLAWLTVLLTVLFIGFWPFGLDFLLLIFLMIGISVFSLCLNFALYPAIEDKVIRKKEQPSPSLATPFHSHEALKWEEEELKSASLADLDFGPEEEADGAKQFEEGKRDGK